ncbi:lytic transglycosylase domain-containing protein [Sulfitobacter sp. SK012]|uniref:lytic transglycosylase domain-containing protein n=1 Tax=Sulfitobacter sp. SK012 TaxID=1389005 RepID=UPI0020C7B78A|nr:lytic transglycosylase domain-containing protein [Sulfitobacter sp. SK012]
MFDTCSAIEVFADRHGLNRDFFARLIWQESRFDPNALSPANARGIAQFIPSTAQLRGLRDPYNPADALEHSAQYLAEMVDRFGNEGMAAIGYNGGERRASGFLKGKGLARETFNYVPIITGLPAKTWRDAPPKNHDMRLSKKTSFYRACADMAVSRRLSPLKRPKPPVVDAKPWGVRLGFGTSKKAARAKVLSATQSCQSAIQKERIYMIYNTNRVAGRKGFYMAQMGRDTRKGAQKLCSQLRAKGCTCLVIKN